MCTILYFSISAEYFLTILFACQENWTTYNYTTKIFTPEFKNNTSVYMYMVVLILSQTLQCSRLNKRA